MTAEHSPVAQLKLTVAQWFQSRMSDLITHIENNANCGSSCDSCCFNQNKLVLSGATSVCEGVKYYREVVQTDP